MQGPALTGISNADVRVLAKLNTAVLAKLRDLDDNIKVLAQSSEFWYAKIKYEFGNEVLKFKPQTMPVQDFYSRINHTYTDIVRSGAAAALLRKSVV